jgi:hypothetical protein
MKVELEQPSSETLSELKADGCDGHHRVIGAYSTAIRRRLVALGIQSRDVRFVQKRRLRKS